MQALQILFNTLKASSELTNVTCLMGEQQKFTASTLPMLVMVPRRGAYVDRAQPGYVKFGSTASLSDKIPIAGVVETVEFHLWAHATTPGAQDPDHFSAIEDLRISLVQALKAQKPTGLYYAIKDEAWTYNESRQKHGRTLVLTVDFDITLPAEQGAIATVTQVPFTVTI